MNTCETVLIENAHDEVLIESARDSVSIECADLIALVVGEGIGTMIIGTTNIVG